MKTFQQWLAEQPENVQTWFRCDAAARYNSGHPHHEGAAKRIAKLVRRYRDEVSTSGVEEEVVAVE